MQLATIEAFSKPNDITLIAPTGSGKTLAFLIPTLTKIDAAKEGVQVVIIVPTRELAIQTEQVFKQMNTGFKINCCYGGHAVSIEKNNLSHPPTVLVGTPGRISYHIENKNIDVNETAVLILDEFDKSLEAGFQDEMSFIIKNLKNVAVFPLQRSLILVPIISTINVTGESTSIAYKPLNLLICPVSTNSATLCEVKQTPATK